MYGYQCAKSWEKQENHRPRLPAAEPAEHGRKSWLRRACHLLLGRGVNDRVSYMVYGVYTYIIYIYIYIDVYIQGIYGFYVVSIWDTPNISYILYAIWNITLHMEYMLSI